jgi:hypothetical protein
VVDFRSDWALCCCRFAFAQIKHLPLTLRFRADKTFVAVASLSHRAQPVQRLRDEVLIPNKSLLEVLTEYKNFLRESGIPPFFESDSFK